MNLEAVSTGNGSLSSIRMFIPRDTGCDITEREHGVYCQQVADRVQSVYGCLCRCEHLEVETTMVWVGHDRASQEELDAIRSHVVEIARGVWTEAKFWGASKTEALQWPVELIGSSLVLFMLLILS